MTLSDYLTDAPWKHKAACLDLDSRLFFPDRTGPSDKRARQICRGCGVREACLDFALGFSINSDVGIWGGTNAQERRKLRKRRVA